MDFVTQRFMEAGFLAQYPRWLLQGKKVGNPTLCMKTSGSLKLRLHFCGLGLGIRIIFEGYGASAAPWPSVDDATMRSY